MWPDSMTWFNPPALVTRDARSMQVVTGDKGDFWRDTYYGFRHDDGHACLAPTEGEFSVEVVFSADYQAQYDQAGLMIRADAAHWIKAGVEYVGGRPYLATVVTVGKSDWSQMPLEGFSGQLGLRISRVGDAVWVQYRLDQARLDQHWVMFRLAYFPPDLAVQAGPATCSPSRAGLAVKFTEFYLGPPRSRQAY